MKFASQASQRQRLVEMLFDVAADGAGFSNSSVARRLGAATQAGAVASFLGFIGTAKERDVFPPRASRRARRPAIDAGRGHGEYEAAVLTGVAGFDGLPPASLAACGSAHFNCSHSSLTQVEYRIGCHSEERLAGGAVVGYPHLAVRARLLGILRT